MTSIDNKVSGSSVSKYVYTYDALGRRADRVQSGSAISSASTDDFSYNTRSEVIGSTNSVETAAELSPTYAYDKIGNRLTASGGALSSTPVSYTANALNQYTAIDSATPTHDLDGNLTDDGGNWSYTWNNENRLSSATNGTVSIDFTYDYQGRLVKKDDGTHVEVYVYDGWNRIATFDVQTSNLTLQTSYLWGLDLSGSMQGAGGVGGLLKAGDLYPTYDANGNIMQKLDGTGAAVMSVDYDPFGNVISGQLSGEYGFSTKPLVDGIDWYYYGFRYYDPLTGRWPSRDPIGEYGYLALIKSGSLNLLKGAKRAKSSARSNLRMLQERVKDSNRLREGRSIMVQVSRNYKAYRFFSKFEFIMKESLALDISGIQRRSNPYHFVFNAPIFSVDPLGLDMWLEGPSSGEPPAHISLSIGDPQGEYLSFSFGANGSWNAIEGIQGEVYFDRASGGEILDFFETSDAIDSILLRTLGDDLGDTDSYGPNTCRTWSSSLYDALSDYLEEVGLGEFSDPPVEFANPDNPLTAGSGPDGVLGAIISTTSSSNNVIAPTSAPITNSIFAP